MSEVRIAHFSDTHVLALRGARPQQFLNKRITGAVNLALARSRHYQVEVFEHLLGAIADVAPDHTVCTGDLVNLALEPEFVRVHQLLEDVFPEESLTLVPGNHDYYAKDAVAAGRFEKYFGMFQPKDCDLGTDAHYPVCRVLDDVFIVGLSSAITSRMFMATGEISEGQLNAMERAFRRPEAKSRFRMLLLHHPLLPDPARSTDHLRRLINAEQVIARLWKCGERGPQLVVHGHNHVFKRNALPGTPTPIIQVASASRAGSKHRAEFNVYVINDGALTAVERHIHDPETHRFIACNEQGAPLPGSARR
jgi:3',5'-cyclic AMP phosphodiesterase CpdA